MNLEQGFTWHRQQLTAATLHQLTLVISDYQAAHSASSIRHANTKLPALQNFATSTLMTGIAGRYITGPAQLVRAIVFDKNREENWSVAWHQDKTIALDNKQPVDGWGPWSVKEGIHHVQPDTGLLNNCITLRCHLDNTDTANGCLQVIPNTHQQIWSAEQIAKLGTEQNAIACEAEAGDILVMRPLLLHASKKATSPMRRRVIHLEFCGTQLPQGLGFAG